MWGDPDPGQVVLCCIKKKAEQITRGKPVSSTLCGFSSCFQVPALTSSVVDCFLKVQDEINAFLFMLILLIAIEK